MHLRERRLNFSRETLAFCLFICSLQSACDTDGGAAVRDERVSVLAKDPNDGSPRHSLDVLLGAERGCVWADVELRSPVALRPGSFGLPSPHAEADRLYHCEDGDLVVSDVDGASYSDSMTMTVPFARSVDSADARVVYARCDSPVECGNLTDEDVRCTAAQLASEGRCHVAEASSMQDFWQELRAETVAGFIQTTRSGMPGGLEEQGFFGGYSVERATFRRSLQDLVDLYEKACFASSALLAEHYLKDPTHDSAGSAASVDQCVGALADSRDEVMRGAWPYEAACQLFRADWYLLESVDVVLDHIRNRFPRYATNLPRWSASLELPVALQTVCYDAINRPSGGEEHDNGTCVVRQDLHDPDTWKFCVPCVDSDPSPDHVVPRCQGSSEQPVRYVSPR